MFAKVVPLRKDPEAAADHGGLATLAIAAGGCPEDLRRLVEVLQQDAQLLRLAGRLARGLRHHGADDLMQSTLERVMRGIGSYRSTGDLIGWVSRIMRNVSVEMIRKETREQVRTREYWLEKGDRHEPDPVEILSEHEIRDRVRIAWQRTSADDDVRLYWERIYVGLSVEQLVRRTGHPRSTVYLMLQRGAAKLVREVGRLLR